MPEHTSPGAADASQAAGGASPFAAFAHKVGAIPSAGLVVEREASPEERAALLDLLGVVAVDRVDVRYRLRPAGAGRFVLAGRVIAHLQQACVVTFEAVAETIDEALDCTYVPAAEADYRQDAEEEALALADIEPIEGDTIDVGRTLYEVVAAAMNPFPRADGATLSEDGRASAGPDAPSGPFAALAGLARPARED
ncbi:MAG: hypothetical protein NW205_12215 [Hyphomicrobiaceae bacterium]|nr:hypothetical protein [Hyphomicrobiaceae bacterium]